MVADLNRRLRRYPDLESASRALAEEVVEEIGEHAGPRPFSLAVSGGRTPARLFDLLGGEHARAIDWRRVSLYFADERCVPPGDPRSNFALVRMHLLQRVPLPPGNVHRIEGELPDPAEAARRYDGVLREGLGATPGPDRSATFDLLLLGMGPDGHTASLFPGEPSLSVTDRFATTSPGTRGDPPVPRVTLTLPAINRARRVAVLVSGSDKAAALADVLVNPPGPTAARPIARVATAAPVEWYIDSSAAGAAVPARTSAR